MGERRREALAGASGGIRLDEDSTAGPQGADGTGEARGLARRRRALAAGARSLLGPISGLKFEALLLFLVPVTLALVTWEDALLRRVEVIDAASAGAFEVDAYGDVVLNGTSAVVADPARPLSWRCRLRDGYKYPFCVYELHYDRALQTRGRNFSNVTTIDVDLEYSGPGEWMRLHLKNHDPRYSIPGRGETNKFNRIEFPVRQGVQRLHFPIEQFTVADWWVSERKISPELSRPQFDNITSIDFQTGAGARPGDYAFRIRRIVIEGYLISRPQFYFALLVGWMVLMAIYSATRITGLKRDLAARRDLEQDALRKAEEAEDAVAEREAAQRAAEESRQRAELHAARVRQVLENTSDCVCSFDVDWRFTFLNQKARDYLGGRADLGTSLVEVFPDGATEIFRPIFREALGRRRPASAELYDQDRDAWYEVCVVPEEDGVTVFFRDVSARKRSEQRAHWLAAHDSLTALPNRLLFQDRIAALTGDDAPPFAILMIDLDEFKEVNDTLGHDAGDSLLRAFAERLRDAVGERDLVARLGGDEFAIILEAAPDDDAVERTAAALFEALRTPLVHDGAVLDLKASIGASLFPRDGANRADLLKHADIAVYAAKAAGRGNLKIFRPEMRAAMQIRMSMVSLARDALAADRIAPWYQPKVDLRSGRIVGFEALLRWRDPQDRIQAPDKIAAAFEDPVVAAQISDRIVACVIEDIGRFTAANIAFGHVAINAAAAELRCGGFADRLIARLAEAGIPPACVQIEVTETVFLGRGATNVEQTLRRLSGAGVRIALDDFGTGYASLSHLQKFPVDILKIDRSFVNELGSSADAAAIVTAVLNLGKSLGLDVVAEGIETVEQASWLLARGCQYGQGFSYAAAVPPAQVPALLAREHGLGARAA